MWFLRRRRLTSNLDALLQDALAATEKLVEWMRIDASLVRFALRNGGDKDLTVPNDDVRLLLAEQYAAMLMAKENVMLLQGKRHFFSIRPIYISSSLDDFQESVAKAWAQLWPDCRYPRYEQLTPEQRYMCFGPDGRKKYGPAPTGDIGKG